MTLTASTSAAVTSSPLAITVTGTSGALNVTTTIAITINAPGGIVDPTPPGPITITAGATTGNTVTVTVDGTNGFSGTVSLSCSVSTTMTNVNQPPTCNLNPASLTITGTTAQTSTLTVTTSARSSASNATRKLFWPSASGAALALLLLFCVPRRRSHWLAILALLLLPFSIGWLGCGGGGTSGGGGDGGTTTGAYTITVTGTAGAAKTTLATISLTVQ